MKYSKERGILSSRHSTNICTNTVLASLLTGIENPGTKFIDSLYHLFLIIANANNRLFQEDTQYSFFTILIYHIGMLVNRIIGIDILYFLPKHHEVFCTYKENILLFSTYISSYARFSSTIAALCCLLRYVSIKALSPMTAVTSKHILLTSSAG